MEITVIVAVNDLQKGHHPTMSDFANEEARRLKDVLVRKQTEKERSVQEHQIKQNQGPRFWGDTRAEAKRIVKELNEQLGKELFLWRSEKSNEIDVIAAEVGREYSIRAVFRPAEFSVTWQCPRRAQEHRLKLFIERDELLWNDGSKNLTAQEAAQTIISSLTKSIE